MVLPPITKLLLGSKDFTSQWRDTESFGSELGELLVAGMSVLDTIALVQAGSGCISKEDLMT